MTNQFLVDCVRFLIIFLNICARGFFFNGFLVFELARFVSLHTYSFNETRKASRIRMSRKFWSSLLNFFVARIYRIFWTILRIHSRIEHINVFFFVILSILATNQFRVYFVRFFMIVCNIFARRFLFFFECIVFRFNGFSVFELARGRKPGRRVRAGAYFLYPICARCLWMTRRWRE